MKTKHILFTIALLFSVTFLNAQDKYEFAVIEYVTGNNTISISIDGIDFIKEKHEIKQGKSIHHANPFLLKIKEYQDQDWEVMNMHAVVFGNTDETFFAYLRKKIKQ